MQFTERTELIGLIAETKRIKGNANSFNQKDKLPEQIDNLNTQQLLDIQLKMIQDDFNFESEDENEVLKQNITQPKEISEYEFKKNQKNYEENEKNQSLINDMLDDFTKEETIKSKKSDFLSKRCQNVVFKIDKLLVKKDKSRTTSCNILNNFSSTSAFKDRATTQLLTNQITEFNAKNKNQNQGNQSKSEVSNKF